jgi:hypothetical protein
MTTQTITINRGKRGRFDKIDKELNKIVEEIPTNKTSKEMPAAEATLVFAENLARVAEAIQLSTANKLSPLMNKVANNPINGMGFDIEKYPPYFRDLCTQLNNIHSLLQQINSTVDAVDI